METAVTTPLEQAINGVEGMLYMTSSSTNSGVSTINVTFDITRVVREVKAGKIEYRVDNGIAVLEINRPPANAYNTELLKELDEAVLNARFDDNVHAIVITGKLEKFFSAGADIKLLGSATFSYKNNFALHGHEVLMRIENTPKIVIAAINGHCVGGGLEVAMAEHMRPFLERAPADADDAETAAA